MINRNGKHFTIEQKQQILSSYIRSNLTEEAVQFLSLHDDLDVFWLDGVNFLDAIDYDNEIIMKYLLDYIKKNTHNQERYKLKRILLRGIESSNISQKMDELISPYCVSICTTANDEYLSDTLTSHETDSPNISNRYLTIENLENNVDICADYNKNNNNNINNNKITEWIDETIIQSL